MPELLIRMKKKPGGESVLSCVRPDGSATWQRNEGRSGRFFPFHDLTHYAVETVLGHSRGFYGLVAEGWDLDDFGSPWPRGPLPADMDPSEAIVGLLDAERAQGVEIGAHTLRDSYSDSDGNVPSGLITLTDDDLDKVRVRRAELFELWKALPEGETLELAFDCSSGGR